jgi:glycine oxidase
MKVVVIGAGITGLAVGWKLARDGASVTVIERAHVGSGASAASMGIVPGDGTALSQHAKALWPSFRQAVEKDSKIDVGWNACGALMVHRPGETPHDVAGSGKFLSADAAREYEPLLGPDIGGAVWSPDEAAVDGRALWRALAVALVRAGGEVVSNEAAIRFEWDGKRITGVVTPFRVHHADAFVLAMGAWSSRIAGVMPDWVPRVKPVKGEVAVLAPPPGVALPKHIVWGNGITLVPQRDRLLVGATVEEAGFDTCLTQTALRWLYRQATGLMPSLADWRLDGHWSGLRAITPDRLPLIGPAGVESLFVASGLCCRGILFAPAVSEVLSRLILDRSSEDPAFDPRRFKDVGPESPLAETPHRDVSGEAGTWRTGS